MMSWMVDLSIPRGMAIRTNNWYKRKVPAWSIRFLVASGYTTFKRCPLSSIKFNWKTLFFVSHKTFLRGEQS